MAGGESSPESLARVRLKFGRSDDSPPVQRPLMLCSRVYMCVYRNGDFVECRRIDWID